MNKSIVITCCWREKLHMGIVRQILLAYYIALNNKLKIIIRFDNSDGVKVNTDFEKFKSIINRIFESLGQVEFEFIETYLNLEKYCSAAIELIDKGVAYYCTCKKKEEEGCGCYNNCFNKIIEPKGSCIRLLSNNKNENEIFYFDYTLGTKRVVNQNNDVVLLKSNSTPTLYLSNAVDNHIYNSEYFIWDRTPTMSDFIHKTSYMLYNKSSNQVSIGILLDYEKKRLSNELCLEKYEQNWASFEAYENLGYEINDIFSLLIKSYQQGSYIGRPYNLSDMNDFVINKSFKTKDAVLPFYEINSIKKYRKINK